MTRDEVAGAQHLQLGRHVLRVVNEYGAVNLFGRGLRERAAAPTSIAHPDHRAEVRRTITEIRYFDLVQDVGWGETAAPRRLGLD